MIVKVGVKPSPFTKMTKIAYVMTNSWTQSCKKVISNIATDLLAHQSRIFPTDLLSGVNIDFSYVFKIFRFQGGFWQHKFLHFRPSFYPPNSLKDWNFNVVHIFLSATFFYCNSCFVCSVLFHMSTFLVALTLFYSVLFNFFHYTQQYKHIRFFYV